MSNESILYSDIKGQILQYLYRGLAETQDPFLTFLQEVSGNGNLNWHLDANKNTLADVFVQLSEKVKLFSPLDGDFRAFLLESLVAIVYTTYERQLVTMFVNNGYNVPLESILAEIDKTKSTAPIQNTNFPRTPNTSDRVNPNPQRRLIPPSLYES